MIFSKVSNFKKKKRGFFNRDILSIVHVFPLENKIKFFNLLKTLRNETLFLMDFIITEYINRIFLSDTDYYILVKKFNIYLLNNFSPQLFNEKKKIYHFIKSKDFHFSG